MMMMICLPPQGTPPTHSSRYGPQHTQHTASTAATPHYPQGRRQTPADAPTSLKRSMLTPFGGPRPRFGAKAHERWFTRSNGSDYYKKKKKPRAMYPGRKKNKNPRISSFQVAVETRRSGSSSRTSRRGRVRGLALPVPRSSHSQCCCCAASGCVCDCDGGVVVLDGNPSSGGSWCI